MSVEAISWALNHAPVPADRGGQPSSACKFVLVGLANHAGPDGTGAFPSVATLTRYTGLSERTIRSSLDRLQAAGIITPCDPDIIAAKIKRADRRPKGWDLNLNLLRDAAEDDADVACDRSPARRSRLAAPSLSGQDIRPDEAQSLHPVPGTGCNWRAGGVQSVQPRGAAAAPEPYEEPSTEPSAAFARPRETPLTAAGLSGGAPPGEFFAALGEAWPMTAAQRARLIPAIQAALRGGWTPAALAAFAGANTAGVRNAYAVLAARFSPAQLPQPPRPLPARPPWCGTCDQRTRRRQHADGDDAGRCPACHPLADALELTATLASHRACP